MLRRCTGLSLCGTKPRTYALSSGSTGSWLSAVRHVRRHAVSGQAENEDRFWTRTAVADTGHRRRRGSSVLLLVSLRGRDLPGAVAYVERRGEIGLLRERDAEPPPVRQGSQRDGDQILGDVAQRSDPVGCGGDQLLG